MKLLSVVLVVFLVFGIDMASAKVAHPQVSIPASAGAAAPVKAPVPAGAAAAKPGMDMLGGWAAGLGLVWLASSLGMGEAFGQIFLLGLFAALIMITAGCVLRSRASRSTGAPSTAVLAQQSASGRSATPRDYSPQNVGNDASARPWERSTTGFDASRFGEISPPGASAVLPAAGGWGVPDGFDVDAFLKASKANFIGLQAAWDRSDIPGLRAMMTDDMLAQIKAQLADREQHSGNTTNVTEVVMLEARLLGIEELDHGYMASVEFSGMVREEVSAGPNPFREVWNITRSKSGAGGWLVAGVQALQ